MSTNSNSGTTGGSSSQRSPPKSHYEWSTSNPRSLPRMQPQPAPPSQARSKLEDSFCPQAASSTPSNKRPYSPGPSSSAPSPSSPRKRKRTAQPTPEESIFIDGDDDYDDMQEQEVQAINNEEREDLLWEHDNSSFIWPPLPHMVSIITNPADSESIMDRIDYAAPRFQRLRIAEDSASPGFTVVRPSGASNSDTWSRTMPLKSSTRRCSTRDWSEVESDLQLITTPGLLTASGGVGVISQRGPAVAIASSAIGGGIGAWTADHRSANKAGALLYWHQSDTNNILIPQQRIDDGASAWEDPECHFRDNQRVRYSISNGEDEEAIVRVYYTVTDVKFNPAKRNVFVSSSYDKTVQSWTHVENRPRVHSAGYSYTYSEAPQLLDFKPNSQILAVGCADGSCYIHNPDSPSPQKLTLNSSLRVEVTSQSWGPESTGISNYIFCGGAIANDRKSKKVSKKTTGGWASAWLLRTERAERVCNFIMGETAGLPCDHLSVNPTGKCIAIASIDDELWFSTRHVVEFFDLRTKPRAILRQPLPASSDANISSDVVHSAFSPDGIFYACAREDNTAQVWDWRWMGRNPDPLRRIEHQPHNRTTSRHSFGVTGMTWITRSGISSPPLLVTGGNDGRIIEWDMRRPDSKLLAELETSVGSLSVGNCYEGEMPLIAGDCDGKLYIYDSKRGANARSARWLR